MSMSEGEEETPTSSTKTDGLGGNGEKEMERGGRIKSKRAYILRALDSFIHSFTRPTRPPMDHPSVRPRPASSLPAFQLVPVLSNGPADIRGRGGPRAHNTHVDAVRGEGTSWRAVPQSADLGAQGHYVFAHHYGACECRCLVANRNRAGRNPLFRLGRGLATYNRPMLTSTDTSHAHQSGQGLAYQLPSAGGGMRQDPTERWPRNSIPLVSN